MEKYDNIEDFKKCLIRFYKQEEALKRDLSYWDYHTSNEQIDENALIEFARQEFFEECKKNGLDITE